MTAKTEEKLLNAMIDLGLGMKDLRKEMKGIRKDLHEINTRLEKLEKAQQKTNLAINELRLSNMRLADEQSKTNNELRIAVSRLTEMNGEVSGHEKRIKTLEHTVYKKSA